MLISTNLHKKIHYWEQPCEKYVKSMWKPCELFQDVKHPVKYPVKLKLFEQKNWA